MKKVENKMLQSWRRFLIFLGRIVFLAKENIEDSDFSRLFFQRENY